MKINRCLYFFVFWACLSSSHAQTRLDKSELIREAVESLQTAPFIQEEPVRNSDAIRQFYKANQYKSIWFERNQLTENAHALLEAIAYASNEGLLPIDYHSRFLNEKSMFEEDFSPAQYDLLFTDALLTYGQHLLLGKVNPETLSAEWRANKRNFDAISVLQRVVSGESVAFILKSLEPTQSRYDRLKTTLSQLRAQEEMRWSILSLQPAIKPGMADPRLQDIAHRLSFWGDLNQAALNEDKVVLYEQDIVEAVKRFQARHGLEVDGVIGAATLRALNVSVSQRIKEITVNLERWRWLDKEFGNRFLVVNIAAFDLRIYDNNQVVLQKPVIVGKSYRKTPVFSDAIRQIVFNPTWTVPRKLVLQDKLPEIKKDRSYLDRMGFTLFELNSSQPVAAETVDWAALSSRSFPYRMVQAPGPLNALGQVKFMFPNDYDVYLHDTPSRELFGKSERAFSSGCIRVFEPLTLAAFLLQNQSWDMDKINDVISTGKTTSVTLKQPMPVHIEYWTAWVDRTGKLNFRNDIYQRDEPLFSALMQPL